MNNVFAFFEGVMSFLSPCLLPMLPLYLAYISGENLSGEKSNNGAAEEFGTTEKNGTMRKSAKNALGFIAGFTAVFTALGAAAGLLGVLLRKYSFYVNVFSGLVIVLLGISFIAGRRLKIPFLSRIVPGGEKLPGNSGGSGILRFLRNMLFGGIFAVSWTPCVGAFLGSALMMAAEKTTFSGGVIMLLCFSAGLGVPFMAAALLSGKLRAAFGFFRKHYRIWNAAAGGFLVLTGIILMSGNFQRITTSLTAALS